MRLPLINLPLADPPAGVEYPFTLDQRRPDGQADSSVVSRCLIGIVVGVVAFAILVPASASGMGLAAGMLAGAADLEAFQQQVVDMSTPLGMVIRHLSLGLLILIAFGLYVGLHRRRGRWLNSVQPGFRWRFWLLAFGISLPGLFIVMWATSGFTLAAPNPEPDWASFLVAIVLTAPIQAAAEEFFFRGYLLAAITPATSNKWVGVVFAAAFFAFFHGSQNWPLLADRFAFGILAGALVILTGGLEAAIAAHVANNLIAFSYATLTTSVSAAAATSEITWGAAVLDVVGYAAVAALLYLLGRKLKVATTTP
ncbi:MAG: CPBP family intramembrane metalloprotease [Propionibacteriaceae bacterium]|jgi:membrane protease YdiL (CAAX protease family)|nr:CPBP family intramembrane metalloprotease [Propionibacteriaceae bacterium]